MELFSDAGSIPAISTKQVLDEHLLFQRRFRRQGNALILITKAPFREIEAVLLLMLRFCSKIISNNLIELVY
nr:hypothetical protein [uncultured Ruminococcus sp.]